MKQSFTEAEIAVLTMINDGHWFVIENNESEILIANTFCQLSLCTPERVKLDPKILDEKGLPMIKKVRFELTDAGRKILQERAE